MFWLALFLGLAVLAVIPVHFHLAALRKAQLAGPAQSAPQRSTATRPCPQCAHLTPTDSAFCEKCGVPMMLWELKLSREARPDDGSGQQARVRPIISQEQCIGCGSCVSACSQPVLEIVAGKSTVVNPDACTGIAACAKACPTGACQLAGQGAARKVEVPAIDPNFETNQKGIYAVGELGGLGLIKNAVNEGQLVIERIKQGHVPREGVLDLIIVGAGPAGLSAGLAAQQVGLSAQIFEQGAFADTIRRFPNRKIVMAEPVRVPMYGSLWISDAPKETLLSVWETIIESAKMHINEHEVVTGVRRNGNDTFHVETSKGTYQSQKVVLAIGKRGTPRKLEAKGAEHSKVMYGLTDAAQYAKVKVLVVGGGDSAAEAAVGLSRQEGNEVTLSYRKKAFTRMRDKNREALSQCIAEGKLRFLPASQVTGVGDDHVELQCEDGKTLSLPNDYVFALLGGTPPNRFLEQLGVSMVTKEVPL